MATASPSSTLTVVSLADPHGAQRVWDHDATEQQQPPQAYM
jgi:hypothetical protein